MHLRPECTVNLTVVGVSWDGLRQTSGFIRHTLPRAKQAGNIRWLAERSRWRPTQKRF